jgi:8-oxo-dGTP diphosphatase
MRFDQVAVCYILRDGVDGASEVLLGEKKKGLGLGKIVGPGGKLEAGETPEQAIVREVLEESGIVVAEADLVRLGRIRYEFPHRPEWSQVSWVFGTRTFAGQPVESEELALSWHPTEQIPFDRMWDDAKYWLPDALAGSYCEREFVFGEDLSTVVAGDLPAR